MFNEFEMMKNNIENCSKNGSENIKNSVKKPRINIEDRSNISQFSYTSIVVTGKMKFLGFVTQTYIYHG